MALRYTVTRGQDKEHEHHLRFVADDGHALSTTFIPQALAAELASLRTKIGSLVNSSQLGETRRVDLMPNSIRLRRQVFGDASLIHGSPFKPSLLLDADEYCARMEWELIADRYAICKDPKHHWTKWFGEGDENLPRCPDGHPLLWREYPLGINKHLGVRYLQWNIPAHSYKPPDSGPTKVLIIGDPGGELDAVEHMYLLSDFFSRGYIPELRPGRLATRDCINEALENEAYAAIYVYAHGACADKYGPSRIKLHDGFLYPKDLPAKFKCQPLIFLNSCWVAKSEWLETVGATDSLAGEMLRRGASSVIGALCPIQSNQAARAALLFFHDVLLASTIGQALARVRMDSYARYEKGEADLSWFAYRLYGDPDRCLASGVWNADGTLRSGPFSFNPALLEKKVEEHRQQRGDSVCTPADMAYAAVELTASGITADAPTLLEPLSVIWKKLLKLLRVIWKKPKTKIRKVIITTDQMDQESDPNSIIENTIKEHRVFKLPIISWKKRKTSDPSSIVPRLIFRSSEDLRSILADLLHLHIERFRQAKQLNLKKPFPLELADLLDACRLPSTPMNRDIEEQSTEIVAQAHKKVKELLVELDLVRSSMSVGAKILLDQASQNGLICGPHTDPYLAVLAAFLQHPMNGSSSMLHDQKSRIEIERIAERLLLLRGNPDQRVGANSLDELIKKLLEIAQTSGEERVDERRLFYALCEFTPRNWRVAPSSSEKSSDESGKPR